MTHTDDDNPYVAPRTPPGPSRLRLSLGSVLLLVALLAVGLAFARYAPGLGVPLLLLLVPAQVRTMTRIGRLRAAGRPLDLIQKTDEFAASAGVTFLILAAASIAFVTTCVAGSCLSGGTGVLEPNPGPAGQDAGSIPSMIRNMGLLPAVLIGLASAALVTYLVGRRLWPHKKDRP